MNTQSGLRNGRICMKKIGNQNTQKSSKMKRPWNFVGTLSALLISLSFIGLVISPVSASNSAPVTTNITQGMMTIMPEPVTMAEQLGQVSGSDVRADTDTIENNSTTQAVGVSGSDVGADTDTIQDNSTTQAGEVSGSDVGADTEAADDNNSI